MNHPVGRVLVLCLTMYSVLAATFVSRRSCFSFLRQSAWSSSRGVGRGGSSNNSKTNSPHASSRRRVRRHAQINPKDDNNGSSAPVVVPVPPMARREEDRVVYAGVAPSGWDPDIPRQGWDSSEKLLDPPVPIKDPYGWLRDESRENETVRSHLREENDYFARTTKHQEPLREALYEEMLSSVKETDYTTPVPQGDYYYYSRTYEGKSYPVYCRAPRSHNNHDLKQQLDRHSWDGSATGEVLPQEEILLDVNLLAQNQSFCSVEAMEISPSQTLLAYTVDYTGNEFYQLVIKDLTTGQEQLMTFLNKKNDNDDNDDDDNDDDDNYIDSQIEWGRDDSTLFYFKKDPVTERTYQLYQKHFKQPIFLEKGNDSNNDDKNNDKEEDLLLFEETNDSFLLYMYKSLDERYLFLVSESPETSETRFLDFQNNHCDTTVLQVITKRAVGVLYQVEHTQGYWWIVTNVDQTLPNMQLKIAPNNANLTHDEWKPVFLMDPAATKNVPLFDGTSSHKSLDSITTFANHVVVSGREQGLPRLWILGLDNDAATTAFKQNDSSACPSNTSFIVQTMDQLKFEEEVYDVGLGSNYEFHTDHIVVAYESLVTPPQSIQIPLSKKKGETASRRTILKEKCRPGYEKQNYGYNRIYVPSRDNQTQIPVSLVYRKSGVAKNNNERIIHLYGYGAYGEAMEAGFDSGRLPLLNRGVVFAIVHVRGGGEMGRQWYEEPNGGKYLCKMNSFFDFLDVAKWFRNHNYNTTIMSAVSIEGNDADNDSDNQKVLLSCEGHSAGGLLIGASINQEPDLFRVALLGVPFVDLMGSMTDASVPLTIGEWEEWGNPNEKKYFDYMKNYCPIQTIPKTTAAPSYPSCLVTAGYYDPRVQYWEAAKFVASVRHNRNNHNRNTMICLQVDMSSGHFSASDRYKYLRQRSLEYAFLLDQLGLGDRKKEN